jgi:YVTN family beta-propeller protein
VTPGIITNYAGGGIGEGLGTTIGQQPWGLAVSGSTLYVADWSGNLVRALNTVTGNETVVAGTGVAGTTGDGGQATAARIQSPTGLALDAGGNLYIATEGPTTNDPNSRVRKVTPGGVITTIAGGGSIVGDGVAATTVALDQPTGVAVDAAGNVYIADSAHQRIRMVDHTTGFISTVAGTGTYGYSGDGGPATSAGLQRPEDVSIDGSGNLWIADTNSGRIREVVSGVINTVAGNGGSGGNYCPSGSATGPDPANALTIPSGISLDALGNPIIADQGSNCVTSLVGGNYATEAGSGTWTGPLGDGGPAASAFLSQPVRAITDGSGDLYVADFQHLRVRRVDHKSQVITTVAGDGMHCSFSGESVPATDASICSATTVTADNVGNVFFTDAMANVVRKVDAGGVITTVAGNGTPGLSGDGGPGTSAQLGDSVGGLATDHLGNLFIADQYNHEVRRVDHVTGVITQYAGNGTSCLYYGDGGSATGPDACVMPNALAVDAGGNLLISDGSEILQVSPGGIITTRATMPNYIGVNALATDAAGNVIVLTQADHGLWEITGNSPPTQITTLPFNGLAIALGPQGQLVVAGNDCKLHLVSPTSILNLAGTAVCGISGDGGLAASATISSTSGLAMDTGGDIFMSNGSLNESRIRRIQAFTAPSAPMGVNAVAGDGKATVSWSVPSGNGGLPILKYGITPHKGPAAGVLTTVSGTPPATTKMVAGLADRTTYTFTVTASNAWATSADSLASAPVMPTLFSGHITTYVGAAGAGQALSMGQVPFSLALMPWPTVGHLVVGDWANPVVRDLDSVSGQEAVIAGNDAFDFSGDGGNPAAAAMQGAGAVAQCGSVTYVADTFNYRIRKVDGGTITTVAGTGIPGYWGDGGPGASAQIGQVYGLACSNDSLAVLYIADSSNGAIRALDPYGNIYTVWAGLAFPTGIVSYGNEVLYVADSSANVVWLLDGINVTECVVAGIGPANSGCTGGSAPKTSLKTPRGIYFASTPYGGYIYVADEGNNKVRVVDPNGNISTIAGTGVAGFSGDGGNASLAKLNHPTSVVWSGERNLLYIADYSNARVRAVDTFSASHIITTIAGNGTQSLFGDGAAATSAEVGNPYAVAVDAAGNEYVADNADNAIRKVDVTGVISRVAGTGIAGYSGNGGAAANAQLSGPRGVVLNSAGDIFISDTGNNVIRKVDHSTGVITPVAGNGRAGFSGDNGAATSAMINTPRSLAVDAAGNLYIADTANNRVRKWNQSTHAITTFAGSGTAGFSGDGGLASAAKLNSPRGLAFDSLGNLFISDTGNNRVRKVDGGGVITTVAGTGVGGAAGDGGPAINAQLNFPFGLSFDGGGNLFIADTLNERIRMVNPLGKISSVVATCGTLAGFRGDGGPAPLGRLNVPYGVTIDNAGDLLIADAGNNRIRAANVVLGGRGLTCPSPVVSPAPRGTASSSSGSAPPRVAEQGSGSRSATLVPDVPVQHGVLGRPIKRAKTVPPALSAPAAHPAAGAAQPAVKAPPAVQAPITVHGSQQSQTSDSGGLVRKASASSSPAGWLPLSLMVLMVAIGGLVIRRRMRLRVAIRRHRPPD